MGASSCAGFWTPAMTRRTSHSAAGVQKAPRHEVAGSGTPAKQRALWGFDFDASRRWARCWHQGDLDVRTSRAGRTITDGAMAPAASHRHVAASRRRTEPRNAAKYRTGPRSASTARRSPSTAASRAASGCAARAGTPRPIHATQQAHHHRVPSKDGRLSL